MSVETTIKKSSLTTKRETKERAKQSPSDLELHMNKTMCIRRYPQAIDFLTYTKPDQQTKLAAG